MTKSKFSEHQIINILKQTENGRTVAEVCREHSISPSTYFKWKTKYGGMEASDLKKMRDLVEENSRLKRRVRRFITGEPRSKGCDRKKALEPVAKKAVVLHLQVEHHLSERRACRLVNLSRSVFRYAAHGRDDSEVQTALVNWQPSIPNSAFARCF